MGADDRLDEILEDWLERRDGGAAADPEEVIRAHPDLAGRLRARFAALAAADEVFAEDSPASEAPETIGEFRILRELGSGGMGRVYLARRDDEDYALKVVHPHLLGRPGFFKRFLREAELGRQVEHENVVRTFDLDAIHERGRHYHFLVMEYVEGRSLRELLDELDRVPEELCRQIGLAVGRALVAIHGAGAIHRDLKPENVLITAENAVKVMDLGVARLVDEALRLSQTGAFVGSVLYAAPEQFGAGRADARADLYSLGLLLYELATGQHPFRADDMAAVMQRHLKEEARRISELNPQLSPFFEEVIHALLAKDPDLRFSRAAELVAVLEERESARWWKERARRIRAATRRPLRRIRIPRETPLCGREEELARLLATWELAQGGQGQVVLVEGEAGIGKTRLVDEVVGRLEPEGVELNFLFGSYPPGGAATGSGAFSNAYREQFGDAGAADYLKETPLLVPAFEALLRGEPAPAGVEPLTRDSIQTVFVHATRALAAERPTVILIDDLHFAPEEGRALFMSIALAVPGHRVLLIGSSRPGLPEEYAANLDRIEQASRMSLTRLGPKDLVLLLKDAFQSEHLAQELGVRIAEKSDGNPFFVFEIIRGLKEGQFLSQGPDGSWHTTRVIQEIQVPSSITDLVQVRISDLDDDLRNLLEVAACLGFEFDPSLVAGAMGEALIPALQSFARIEKRHRLVRSAGKCYVFDHHQVQESLYAGIHETLREQYHLAIGEALERRTGAAERDPKELRGPVPVDLCDHFLRAGRSELALRYLNVAYEHLICGYQNARAIELTERALAYPELLRGPERAEVLLRLCGPMCPLDSLGWRQKQEKQAEEAASLAREAESDELLQLANLALGRVHFLKSSYEEAAAVTRQAIELATSRDDKEGAARAETGLGNILLRQGHLREAHTCFDRSLALSREVGDRKIEATSIGNLGVVLLHEGRAEEARKALTEALYITTEVRAPALAADIRYRLGCAAMHLGLMDLARRQLEGALRAHRELGERRGELADFVQLGAMFAEQREMGSARSRFEHALGVSKELGDRRIEAMAAGLLAKISQERGDLAAARDGLERQLAICRDVGDRNGQAAALLDLGYLAGDDGDYAGAIDRLWESISLGEECGFQFIIMSARIALGEIKARQGGLQEARSSFDTALHTARSLRDREGELLALCHLACLPGGTPAAALAALKRTEDCLSPGQRCDVRHLLWKATDDSTHLREAKRLLDDFLSSVPEEDHCMMLSKRRLYRDITAAWEEHGGGE